MGIAGRLAKTFLRSKLTPLMALASLGMGAVAIVATPREEEPQISVPMIDVMAAFPGATPSEVEHLLVQPIEQQLWEIPGVEHLYSTSSSAMAMVTVRFKVGEDQQQSVAKVHAKLLAAADRLPAGAYPPFVKPHSIDDVPILALTLHSGHYDSNALRAMAVQLQDALRAIPDVAAVDIIGGERREMRVTLDPARLAATGVSIDQVSMALASANARLQTSDLVNADRVYQLTVSAPLDDARDVQSIVVASRGGAPVYVRDVADVSETFGERASYVTHSARDGNAESAVTISLAKRPGANATVVANSVLERLEQSRARLLPTDVSVEVTRNYGETASEKASELIVHLLIATLSVTALIWIFLGWREALVVLLAVPITLALTLFAYYALGYSLNRITLFALIFSIGILVDDAIVVVENIYRHLAMKRESADEATVTGVDEVGNATILATFAVIAAILPMAMVSGMMGPYMRPIPVGASFAMIASLGVAFIVTPYFAIRLLGGHAARAHAAAHEHTTNGNGPPPSRFARSYTAFMQKLMQSGGARAGFYGTIAVLLLLAVALMPLKLVQVKMLPFDNKSEFQVILDLPEGTTLERSAALGAEVSTFLLSVPELSSTEVYAGTAAPFNFNGLVRHYFMRRGANVADVQVNLFSRHDRKRASHAIAVAVRSGVDSIAARYDASAKIAEIPPGPPVLSTLVAEVYAADDSTRLEAAERVKEIMLHTAGVVDVDWSMEAPQHTLTLRLDRSRAARAGANLSGISSMLLMADARTSTGLMNNKTSREGVPIVPGLSLANRSSVEALLSLPVAVQGGTVPLSQFAVVDSGAREPTRFRRDLRPVIYVTGDVAGSIESPLYAILAMNKMLDTTKVGGKVIGRYNAMQPATLDETAIKWDGEWQITIEVFRDLGVAFAGVLVLIYVLVVGWFQSFKVPLVIMAPIPLTLIGILPAHAMSGAFFTATSMIGMIALAGIIVRNSILLVDFIQLAESRGTPLAESVIEAGNVRFRPIALTAAAVLLGGMVMVLDPIFQGLAVALMSGAVVATLLTMVVVPLLYWELRRSRGGTEAVNTTG